MSNKPLKKVPGSKEQKPNKNVKPNDSMQQRAAQSKLKLDPTSGPHPHMAKDKS